jgi:parallel beta-helix repeat protein
VITQNTVLRNDVGPCPGDGIVIGADNITVNLNGHRVLGNSDQGRSGEFAGIRLPGRTGVTVTGHPGGQASGQMATVSGFEAGVVIGGGSANTVENLAVRDNIGKDEPFFAELGDGIVIFDSPSNRILNNVVVHNGIFDGIGVLGPASDNTIVQGNTVEDTVGPSDGGPAGQGIIVNGAEGTTATRISGTMTADNTVRGNASGGLANINNVDASIVRNIVEDNGHTNLGGNGIGVQFGLGRQSGVATRVLIEDNEVHRNNHYGITIREGAHENRIINNDAARGGPTFSGNFDLHDGNRNCDSNVWLGNTWGTGLYNRPCTATGGSGPPFPVGPEGPFGDPTCHDHLDNDRNELTDADDAGCQPPPPEQEGPPGDPTCFDGIDNDQDHPERLYVDQNDPDCRPPEPEGEEFGNCSDLHDNDQDGFTDVEDPDCPAAPPPVVVIGL